MNINVNIIVSGVVQGVGFRYFVSHTANSFGILGFVRNLYSGDVEIEAEGEESIINAFVNEIKIGPRYSRVTNIKIQKKEFTGKYNKFDIRY